MASMVHRRVTPSSRLKENPAATAGPNPSGRNPKSGSPEATVEEVPSRTDTNVLRKKKTSTHAVASSSSQPGSMRIQRSLSSLPEAPSDHVRRSIWTRPVSRSSDVEAQATQEPRTNRKHGKSKRRERSPSRDASSRPSVHPLGEESGVTRQRHTRGPTVGEDYHKIKEELEAAKKQVSNFKKTVGKQSKTIEELRKELSNAQRSRQEEREQVEKLQNKSKKNDEAISTIEANMNCQICMDMLSKPYGLSPCGHVLCLGCLQEWFRAAPAGEEDMYDDDPDTLIYRKKTCPVCRTTVLSRPIPLFVVKSIAAALSKAKDSGTSSPPSSPAPEGDPWEGIFPDPTDQMWIGDDVDGGHYDSYSDAALTDVQDYGDISDPEDWPFDGYGSDEGDPPYEGDYIQARWAPYAIEVDPQDYPFDFSEETLSLLRRGATTLMIDLFDMTYTDHEGMRAVVNGNVVYLGWNIERHPADESGEQFMEWIEADVYNHPERWDREDNFIGTWTAWRLVREDEAEDYDSDSDADYFGSIYGAVYPYGGLD